MAEPTQPSPAPAATPAAPAAPAAQEPQTSPLEKVYTDFGIEAEAEKFQPQSPPPAQPAPAQAPVKFDPFDPNFPVHLERISKAAQDAQSALHQTRGELNQLQHQLRSERVEADISQAAKTLSEKAGIDPEIARVAFEAQARKDPRLLQVWNNRQRNPRAYEAALSALGSEFAQKYAVKQDPQLAENQRAVAASRQTMATTQKTSDAEEWAALSPSERQAKVQLLLRQGGR